MRWPWVSRAAYNGVNARLHATYDARDREVTALHERYRCLLDAERGRYDSLLEKFTALRLAGAVVPEPVPLPIERRRDPCAEAILAKAGRDTALQSLMFEQLAKDRAAGKNETEILRAIQTGEAPDPWTMPA